MVVNYYFLASLLPSNLILGNNPEVPFSEFNELCLQNLNPSDLEQIKTMRRYTDIKNLRPLWQKKSLDPHGNYNDKELETHLLLEEGFPEYVFEFLRDHESVEERLDFFPKLLAQFFTEEIAVASNFLKNFLVFERSWRLLLLALRAKAYQKDVTWELQHEDASDDEVAYIIAQKDSNEFEVPKDYEELKEIYHKYRREPLKMHWEMEQFKLKKIETFVESGVFSADNVLSYLAQLIIVENWLKLNHDQGVSIVENIMKERLV